MRKCLAWLSVLAAVALVLPSAAMAQTHNELVVDVPFSFIAGDRTLPPGTYRVDVLPEGVADEPALITLQTANEAGRPDQMIFQSVTSQSVDVSEASWTEDPRLKFEKVGDMYFLAEVYAP